MAIYLFVLLSISQVRNVCVCVREDTVGGRVGALAASSLYVVAYVWYGWYSGLVF